MLEITATAPIGTNLADFVISADAFWTDKISGHTYRASRMIIADNGMAWVFNHRQTKKLDDYKSGEGMWLVLRTAGQPIGKGWDGVQGDLIVALLQTGWSRTPDDQSAPFPAWIWSLASETEIELRQIEGVTISAGPDRAVEYTAIGSPAGSSTAFLGWLVQGELWTGAQDEHIAPKLVPARMATEYVLQIVERELVATDQRNHLVEELADSDLPGYEPDLALGESWDDEKDAEVRALVDLDPELGGPNPRDTSHDDEDRLLNAQVQGYEHGQAMRQAADEPAVVWDFGQAYSDLMSAAFPRTVILDPIPVDSIQEGDRVLQIDGVQLGHNEADVAMYADADEPGLLVEHVTPATFEGVWSVTVWMGGGMVGLLLDSGTKARVLRQR
jgi:hypothetical protein